MEQISLLDMVESGEVKESTPKLNVVKASFVESTDTDWEELFEGFDELYFMI